MTSQQPRTQDGHPVPRVALRCRRCQTRVARRLPCEPGTVFSWSDNPHLQVQKAIDHRPLLLVDSSKEEHVLEFASVDLRDDECFRAWRSRFFFDLMGSRDLPQRCLTDEAPLGAALQFRWRENLHLVRDDFAYLMDASGDAAWDIKTLTIVDTSGTAHSLAFGTGTDSGCRVEKWRTQTINNTIKSFRRVFGTPPPAGVLQDEVFESTVDSYVRGSHAGRFLSLDEHLENIQRLVVPKLASSGLRPEISGPNFPDFFRGAVARSPRLQTLMRRLPWARRIDRPFSRDARTGFLRRLVAEYVATCEHGKNFAHHAYNIWRLYGDAFLDHTLPRFRRRLLADAEASKPLARFLRPQDQRYRYGDTGKRQEPAPDTAPMAV
ncbi:hypothetical protein J7T55_013098 [Diaporthe amygdali]|uniref:uncharacterized protein n=1 Tax=Phomopsis amygdali TaxID=1214568 RepID=UPI0022FEE6C9|nr:uncharacterized protein J7T55_013098 [Diaporthe amygdali]KAJ0118842.1 hypothetical protein J7T55_013098 [Diaporthe amygdali]